MPEQTAEFKVRGLKPDSAIFQKVTRGLEINMGKRLYHNMYLLLLFILILAIAGCKKDEQPPDDQAGIIYEETEIALPSHVQVLSIKKITDDQYICSYLDPQTERYGLAYTDITFNTFTPIGNDAGQLVHVRNQVNIGDYTIGFSLNYDMDSNRNLYVLQYQYDGTNTSKDFAIFVYDSEGVLQNKIPIAKSEHIDPMIPTELLVQPDRFLIVTNSGMQVVDREGNTITELASPSTSQKDLFNQKERLLPDGLLIDVETLNDHEIVLLQNRLRAGATYLIRYDLSENEIQWEREMPRNFTSVAVHYEPDRQQLLVASGEKIIAYGMDGTELGERINFNEYGAGRYISRVAQGNEAFQPKIFLYDPSKVMYVYLIESTSREIKKIFSYRELTGTERTERLAERDNQIAAKTTIALFVPYLDGTIEQKMAQFERLNPDLHVELRYFREKETEFNSNDYLQYVNLQLLTNQTQWDVMAVQHLPFWTYTRKGLFADLDEIAKDLWAHEKDKYFANILDAMRVDGKRTVFPARITFVTNLADSRLAESLSPNHTWDDLIRLSNEAKSTNPAIKSWMFNSAHFLVIYGNVLNSYLPDILGVQHDPETREQLLGALLDTVVTVSNPEDHVQTTGQTALFTMRNMSETLVGAYLNEADRTLISAPASPLSGKRAFNMYEGYAINAASEVQDEAFRLILFLAEHATQNNFILKSTFDLLLQEKGKTENQRNVIQQLKAVVESLDTYSYNTYDFPDIRTTVEQYVNGIINKETAVTTIMEKLWLYENE